MYCALTRSNNFWSVCNSQRPRPLSCVFWFEFSLLFRPYTRLTKRSQCPRDRKRVCIEVSPGCPAALSARKHRSIVTTLACTLKPHPSRCRSTLPRSAVRSYAVFFGRLYPRTISSFRLHRCSTLSRSATPSYAGFFGRLCPRMTSTFRLQ